ncbi:hypothetical protein HMPREF1522_0951 [Actinomyces sp. ICM54]|uniref:hypothetical protein n=1 Tax=Actinomyces sp. ICM54 TaxID=936549 RepID=UPI00044F3323|nr:hypothetical protein [Actinomyces sp. ICM54]EWC97549.1 hypothetical protein HMPREF1522_0951 [Actinomyces sp. ICM54]
MEWIDFVTKGIGALLALGALLKAGSKLYTKFKNGSEFRMWFGRRRKVKGLKYVSIFQKRGALSSRNEISTSVRQQLTREIARDVVRSYSIEKRTSRFSSSTRDQVRILVIFFFLFGALICIAALEKIVEATPAQQEFIDAAKYMLWWCVGGFLVMSILLVIIALGRAFAEFRSMTEASRHDVVQVPIESIPYCVEKDRDYIFVDATIRKRYQVPFMGRADSVQMLLDHGAVTEREVPLKKSEAKQIKADNYEEIAGQLVDSFLSKALICDREPVCFVFSQVGITAVFITQLLRSKGLRAFYIGATNGYESEVREAIREIRILRESGLI